MIRAPIRFILDRWPWFAFLASALMLGLAHYAQDVDGLAPCILCLKQREAYWIAGSIGLAGILAGFTPWKARLMPLINGALAIAFLYGFTQATYHMGAEVKWWDGPKACSAGVAQTSAQEIAAMMAGEAPRVIQCEDPTYWPFPGITMATWNVGISLALALASVSAAIWRKRA